MRYRIKTKIMGVVLRLIVILTTILLVLAIHNVQKAEGFTSHKGRFCRPNPINCGDTITNHVLLTTDLDCSEHSGGAALTLKEGAELNLNGKKIIGNHGISCIEIREDGVKIWNGTVTQCDHGIRVRSGLNKIIRVKVSDSINRGIRIQGNENVLINCQAASSGRQGIQIEGDENLLINCLAANSGRQGIQIDGGNGNKIFFNKVRDNCRDGIEIDNGSANLVFYNDVADNGNPDTCADFDEDYNPWFYAGIDVLSGSENNEIKHNRAGCNLGCVGSDDFPCTARERDFWDENVDNNGNFYSTNEWEKNSISCRYALPEFSPNPND